MIAVLVLSMMACAAQPEKSEKPADKQPAVPAKPAPVAPDGAAVVKGLVAEAEKLAPLVKSELAKGFLAKAGELPVVKPRVVYRTKDAAISAAEWEKLSEEERKKYKPRECSPQFYFYTGYGSPLVYARVAELMAEHGVASLAGKRVLDFGYGTIGHLQLMARCGAEAHGVEIEPLFEALYNDPMDLFADGGSPFANPMPSVALHTGQWPADKALAKKVTARGTFDVITSKNTLKKGYVNPEPPKGKTVDERQLVKLGVSDAEFLKSVSEALKPGGLFIVYNICPAQNAADDPKLPYLPMADGRSPFTREQYQAAGFEVVAFDVDDQAWTLGCWRSLGYDGGKAAEDAAKETFAWYTIVKKKAQSSER